MAIPFLQAIGMRYTKMEILLSFSRISMVLKKGYSGSGIQAGNLQKKDFTLTEKKKAYLIIGPEEETPHYAQAGSENLSLPAEFTLPEKPKWSTLFIAAGKKDKVNKIDVVGFLSNKGKLKKDEIGLIEVKDFSSFAAIRKSKMGIVIELVKNEKIKNKKVKIAIAR